MSRASVEQALTGLIPTLNGPLPVELVELAMSLLARSRSVAHSLKPEEEIARPYACAHLACDRLKKRLNLPNIQSRPPCPPRIYKKLYNYLETAIGSATGRDPETPKKKAAQSSASTRTTPKTPLSGRKTPRSTAKPANAQELPDWLTPTVRQLVKSFSYPSAAPHVFAGVEATFPLLPRMSVAPAPETPSKRPRRAAATASAPSTGLSDSRTLALLAVILFYVLTKLMDKDITPEQFSEWRDLAVSSLLSTVPGKGSTESEIIDEIDELMPMARAEGWLTMEWFLNIIPEGGDDEMEGVETTGEENGKAKSARKVTLKDTLGSDYIGLGTMMQDATDYLGERQCEDYKIWKAVIMRQIKAIETK